MTQILRIQSSIFGNQGVTSQLADQIQQRYLDSADDVQIYSRDLSQPQLPHFDAAMIAALGKAEAERSAEEQARVALADSLIEELQAADVIIVTAPMYNFSIPSQLKSWFDYVARSGVTFRYTEAGAEGLLKGKKVYVVTARGGKYLGTEMDSQTPLLATFLSFIGLDEQTFIYAEGVNMGDEPRAEALESAATQIAQLTL